MQTQLLQPPRQISDRPRTPTNILATAPSIRDLNQTRNDDLWANSRSGLVPATGSTESFSARMAETEATAARKRPSSRPADNSRDAQSPAAHKPESDEAQESLEQADPAQIQDTIATPAQTKADDQQAKASAHPDSAKQSQSPPAAANPSTTQTTSPGTNGQQPGQADTQPIAMMMDSQQQQTASDQQSQQSTDQPVPRPKAPPSASALPATNANSTASSPSALGGTTLQLTNPSGTALSATLGEADASTTSERSSGTSGTNAAGPEGPNTSPGSQMIRGMMAMVRTTGGRLTMRLEPASLGSMRVQVNITQGRVQAVFHASTLQARELLSQQIDSLRQALENQGLKVDRIQIQALNSLSESDSTSNDRRSTDHDDDDQRRDAAGDESRGNSNQNHDKRHALDTASQDETSKFGMNVKRAMSTTTNE